MINIDIKNLLAKFSLNDLLIFKEVYELKSYSKAAASLNISTPTISRKIHHLGNFFGDKLFVVKKNFMYHSNFAELLYQQVITYLIPVIQQFSLMKSKSEIAENQISGTFKIQLPIILSTQHITPKIPNFIAKYPNLKLELLYSNSTYEIMSSKIDLCLTLNKEFADKMNAVDLNKDIYGALYCSKEYAHKYGIPKNIEELDNHNLIGVVFPDYRPTKHLRLINSNDSNLIKTIVNPDSIQTNNSDQNKALISSNETIAPLLVTKKHQKKMYSKLVPVLPDWYVEYSSVYLITNQYSNQYINNIIKEFLLECLSDI